MMGILVVKGLSWNFDAPVATTYKDNSKHMKVRTYIHYTSTYIHNMR